MDESNMITPDWSFISTADLLARRYWEGVRLRNGTTAFPDYTYKAYIVAANRVLDTRLGTS